MCQIHKFSRTGVCTMGKTMASLSFNSNMQTGANNNKNCRTEWDQKVRLADNKEKQHVIRSRTNTFWKEKGGRRNVLKGTLNSENQ